MRNDSTFSSGNRGNFFVAGKSWHWNVTKYKRIILSSVSLGKSDVHDPPIEWLTE